MAPIKLSVQNDFKIDDRFGKYPADWVLHRMGDLGDFYGGATPSTQQPSYWNGSINWLVPSDISTLPEEQKYIYDTGDKITEAGLAACSAVLLPAGTVTMSSRATLGDCVILGKEMCTNQGFISCKCNEHIINEYLLYWIRQYKNYISRYAAGTTFLEIGRRQFKKLRIAIPEPEEQALIVGALADIDRAIEVTRKAIDQAGLVKKALMQNLLSGRLKPDGTWRKPDEFYVDEKFGRVPKGWNYLRLRDVLNSQLEYGANTSAIPYSKDFPRFIRITDIDDAGNLLEDTKVSLDPEIAKSYMLEENDFLFARTGNSVGRTFLYKNAYGPSAFAGYLVRAKLNQSLILPEYLNNLCLSQYFDSFKVSMARVGAKPNINAREFSNFRFILPERIDEQDQIAKSIYQFTFLIEAKTRKINYLIKIKKSLMQNLLTGKIRVQAE
jgi:type I restriction enzyme S subunit